MSSAVFYDFFGLQFDYSFKTKYFEIVSQDQKRLYLTFSCNVQCNMFSFVLVNTRSVTAMQPSKLRLANE